MASLGIFLFAAQALAQEKRVTGQVTSEQGTPLTGASVVIKGTRAGTVTNTEGRYSIRASVGQVLQFRYIGTAPVERTVGDANVIDVKLERVATSLDAVVVTALGQTTEQRAIGTAQQAVDPVKIVQSQRPNFVNALQGRVAGVEVTSTSGVPGASTSITIRGISSISSSNQPLFIVDGLPIDNKTLNSGVLGSDYSGSPTAFNNRGVDFTNRAADINPEDIESLVVLKGPEASALYGIDAANGAIVITTKHGRSGQGGFQYDNSFTFETPNGKPFIQNTWGPSAVGSSTFLYFGNPYPSGTKFYDNVDGFFQTGMSQRHNLAFTGASGDGRVSYRVSGGVLKSQGVIPNSLYNRINLTGASQGQINSWLGADLSMQYAYDLNDQPFKGDNGPLLGLLVWPQTDNASDWLTPAGTRRRITSLGQGSEVDNPYFSVNKNKQDSKNNRMIVNLGVTVTPFSWGSIRSNLGADNYTNHLTLLRHPESVLGTSLNGILDVTDDIVRNINSQTLLNINGIKVWNGLSISGLLGNAIKDEKATDDAMVASNFLDPNFVSINNGVSRAGRTTITQRRVVSAFGQAVANYNQYLFVTVTGRNDWTSTIPKGANSFFYPSVSGSYIFSDAFPSVGKHMTGKVRAAYAEVGRDAAPYSYRPALQAKTTSFTGYGYDFWGPNLALQPEFAKSWELGTELGFFQDRLGIDATVYRKETDNQIVQNIRGSYGTGFILFNLNGAKTRNHGVELTVRGTPVQMRNFSWDVQANFNKYHGETVSLPYNLPESYVSDTWLVGNVRNGTEPGLSTESLTGNFYLRATSGPAKGQLLIDPSTGLPLRNSGFVDAGYDRTPKYTVGLSNTFKYKRFTLDALVDFRRGGDVFNATEWWLTARGLSKETLDREQPRVIQGVLRDGKQNSANPTYNNIVVVPAVQPSYYTNISEELFIEKNINWIRLRDITLSYALPERYIKSGSIFVTGTDLFLITNYTGMDPIVNGNDAAVGGSGGNGIDYGNFPIPRGLNFGLRFGF